MRLDRPKQRACAHTAAAVTWQQPATATATAVPVPPPPPLAAPPPGSLRLRAADPRDAKGHACRRSRPSLLKEARTHPRTCAPAGPDASRPPCGAAARASSAPPPPPLLGLAAGNRTMRFGVGVLRAYVRHALCSLSCDGTYLGPKLWAPYSKQRHITYGRTTVLQSATCCAACLCGDACVGDCCIPTGWLRAHYLGVWATAGFAISLAIASSKSSTRMGISNS